VLLGACISDASFSMDRGDQDTSKRHASSEPGILVGGSGQNRCCIPSLAYTGAVTTAMQLHWGGHNRCVTTCVALHWSGHNRCLLAGAITGSHWSGHNRFFLL